MSLSLSVRSQSGPPKSVGGGSGGGGRGSYTTTPEEPGVKLDEKSIENGLEGQKFLVVCLFWGGCHHPNKQKIPICKLDINKKGERTLIFVSNFFAQKFGNKTSGTISA